MKDPWDKLESEMRAMPLQPLSPEIQQRILRQLATSKARPAASPRRHLWWATAAAACVTVGLAIWMLVHRSGPTDRPTDRPPGTGHVELATLAADWQIDPTGDADYRVLQPDRIELIRGEVFVKTIHTAGGKTMRPALYIQTPCGTATAADTDFYVAVHTQESSQPKGSPMFKKLTRILVLTGMVTLANQAGSVTSGHGHLLAAEPDKPPVDLAVTANNGFGADLYAELAKENPGKNLFFSPYSISSALAMTAEGARGETADQMGTVLRFPAEARRIGNDAQLIPWNIAMIHTGIAALNDRFNAKPVPQELRDRIAAKNDELAAIQKRATEFDKAHKWREYGKEMEKARKLAAELNPLLRQVDQYELRVANALWGEQTYPFRQSYLDTINKYYHVGAIFPVDFVNNHEAARLKINDWVEKQTKQRIKELLAPNTIDPSTRLVLTNAVYFKGEWSELFAESETHEDNFATPDGNKVRVPLMHRRNINARYAAFNADGTLFQTPAEMDWRRRDDSAYQSTLYPGKDGFVMGELLYKGGDLSMVVIVPRDAGGLPELEKKLTEANLRNWTSNLRDRNLEVHLPKFKVETSYQMNDTLKAMGMVRAFESPTTAHGAQFNGMCASEDPGAQLFIGGVIHKAFVEVNEKGTEAAAATAVDMKAGGVPRLVPFIPNLRADKPFVFAIRDVKTGTILFLGRIVNPK